MESFPKEFDAPIVEDYLKDFKEYESALIFYSDTIKFYELFNNTKHMSMLTIFSDMKKVKFFTTKNKTKVRAKPKGS